MISDALPFPAFLPPAPRVTKFCACGEPLTMEMELDAGECVDCMADAARVPDPTPEALGLHPLFTTEHAS